MLADILILLRQPFNVGDQIVSGGQEDTFERIETCATLIKTYDGRRVVIPNPDIYPTQVHLFHDQTEVTDGDPSRQRGGWPAGKAAVPRPPSDHRTGSS
nr:mechanosensitive ion channel domain-containing protein [Loktanella sp. M215]